MKNIKSKFVEWTLAILAVVVGAYFNNLGLWGWLPIIANLTYSLAMFRFRDDETKLKIVFIFNLIMYCIFSIYVKSYTGAVANVLTIISSIASLQKVYVEKKKYYQFREGH